jgi:hypothetical protein
VVPEPGEIDRLQAICERLSPKFRAEMIVARQACFRPVTQDGLPLIGSVPQIEGVYVATQTDLQLLAGHSNPPAAIRLRGAQRREPGRQH